MDDYLELYIDIFDQPRQQARVLQSLTVGKLIDEILKEFDLDGSNREVYALFLKGKSTPLDPRMTMSQLDLQMHDELIFRHSRTTGRLVTHDQDRAFLQDERTNSLFEIKFNPAVLGRTSSDPAHNASLAVNMKFHPDGGYVSRRHAQIVLAGGQYYLESLSNNNPTSVNDSSEPLQGRVKLNSGDQISLSAANIRMTFFHLKAGTFNPDLPLATLRVETGPRSGQIIPLDSTPFTLGREGCDLCFPEDKGMAPRQAVIRYNAEGQKYELVLENRPPMELPPSATVEISGSTRVHFQMG